VSSGCSHAILWSDAERDRVRIIGAHRAARKELYDYQENVKE